MLRCIEIARNGLGLTAPNPSVGAVIVYNDKIIGEGFTSSYGGNHAEVNAIQSVTDKSILKEATLYVTLEPCSHFGKTPPCADLINTHGIKKVVIGLLDPHEKVAGKGVQKLIDKGCKVSVGILENQCREHHRRFLTFHERKRPYIILKWAETADGFISPAKEKRGKNKEPYWITNMYSRQLVHQWRAAEQAILVGTNTVLEDNPKLDVRNWTGKNPLRIILDKDLKIKKEFYVFDGSTPTLVLTSEIDQKKYNDKVQYQVIDFDNQIASQICELLYSKHITSLLIEGGTRTLQTFIDNDLWDEARVFVGATSFKKGVKAPQLSGSLIATHKIKTDTLSTYRYD
jgi:diaminohydroxyphosphoribosylaminopyrimidine deaminase/5-amino-6-(5-phosphoribosylamino)uracil reductase